MTAPSDAVGAGAPKQYDRAYFDRWYRSADSPLGSADHLRRAVRLAVSVTESVLTRPLRDLLDIGCGEARWQPELRRMRPEATYLGIDPSPYAIDRFGERRNVRAGRFGELSYHVFDEPFDLVVCSDVLHYVDDDEIHAGLPALVERTYGVALLEVFTAEDDPEGDREGFHARPAAWYRDTFSAAGLVPIGFQMYVPPDIAEDLEALDLPF